MIIARAPAQAATRAQTGLPTAGAFAFALEKDGFLRPCGLYGNVPELRGGRLVWWPMEERQWSVYVIVYEHFLVEGLPDPAYTHPARGVRDMQRASVLKHGIFPDTQC